MKQETARESSPDEPGCQVSRIPFSDIPHQSRLFVDYQNDPLSLKKYYPNVVRSTRQIDSYLPTVRSNYTVDRNDLCNALAEINSLVDAGERTFENIQLLRGPDTVAVVTGQQAGLFSGPLYTIYKALSTVKLAERLTESGSKAVPVFWAATEDHDFAEVSEAFLIDKTGAAIRSEYTPAGIVEGSPVGSVTIDSEIDKVIGALFDELPRTAFSSEMRFRLSELWADGAGFGEAFGKTLAWILNKFGIVYIDPMHAAIKRLSAPMYAAAIENVDEIVSAIIARSRELTEDGFHAQVLVEDDYFPLFWHNDEGVRLALRKGRAGVFGVKGSRQEFSVRELREIADNEPQRLSPGVILRPVVQVYLFPTACYFGGGAEIAYFAQNSEVYRVLDRPVTPVFHRESFTVVEAKQRRVMEKFDLDLADLFDGKEETSLKLAASSVSPDTARLFADVEVRVNAEIDRLDQAVSNIDPTLGANFAKRRRKMMYHIAALKKKTLLAKIRHDEIASRQIDELFAALVPNGELQERSINVFTYLNKYGLHFIDWIYSAIDLDDKEHRIIEL